MTDAAPTTETPFQETDNGNSPEVSSILSADPNVAEALAAIAEAQSEFAAKLEDVDKLTAKLNALLSEAETAANKAAGELASVQAAKTAADTQLQTITILATESKKSSDEASASAAQSNKLLEQARQDRDKTAELSAIAEMTEERITAYEDSLGSLTEEFQSLRERIEGLLPGATSAGLAQSFQLRKDTFKRPKLIWSCLFGVAVISLVAVAGLGESGLIEASGTGSLESLGLGLLHPLPFAGPLVWFAIFAQRRHAEAARLEEDYGYKEAVSRAFEGYKRELQSITDKEGRTLPLLQFCTDVLRTLSVMPGRVFDARIDDPTPLSEAASLWRQRKTSQE